LLRSHAAPGFIASSAYWLIIQSKSGLAQEALKFGASGLSKT
jgi:hypothetical protein